MAYRMNVQFKDGSQVAEVMDSALPKRTDAILIPRQRGGQASVRVIAIWTPSSKMRSDGLVMVEAREV